jgi:hypothetical protein
MLSLSRHSQIWHAASSNLTARLQIPSNVYDHHTVSWTCVLPWSLKDIRPPWCADNYLDQRMIKTHDLCRLTQLADLWKTASTAPPVLRHVRLHIPMYRLCFHRQRTSSLNLINQTCRGSSIGRACGSYLLRYSKPQGRGFEPLLRLFLQNNVGDHLFALSQSVGKGGGWKRIFFGE